MHSGLVLPGGGARGAYQVGVLKAIAELIPDGACCPFDVISGTSVGAINAVSLASHAHEYKKGMDELESLWSNLHTNNIYNAHLTRIFVTVFHWLFSMIFIGLGKYSPISLMDDSPLQNLLMQKMDFEQLRKNINNDCIRAVGVSASSYTQGQAVTFFEGHQEIGAWQRKRRIGQRAQLAVQHIMASVALPILFPAKIIDREYFGDGDLRLNTPLSPVIHMGAKRIMVIGIRDEVADAVTPNGSIPSHPSLGSLVGQMLDVAINDNLDSDIERLGRINNTLSLMSKEQISKTSLKPIEIIQIQPSKDVCVIASQFVSELPWTVRLLLKIVDGGQIEDWRLPSVASGKFFHTFTRNFEPTVI